MQLHSNRRRARTQPFIELPLLFLGLCAVFTVFYYGENILAPFFFAIFFVYLLRVILDRVLARVAAAVFCPKEDDAEVDVYAPLTPSMRILKWVGVVMTLAFCIVLMYLSAEHISYTVTQWYDTRWPHYMDHAVHLIRATDRWSSTSFGFNASDYLLEIVNRLEQDPLTKVGQLSKLIQDTLGATALLVVFIIFLLPGVVHKTGGDLLQKMDHSIQNYIVSKAVISFLVALCVYIFYLVIAFPMPFLFAFFTFFLNFIPNLGALISVFIMPLPILLLDPDFHAQTRFLAFVVPFILHGFIGNFIEPAWFGDSLELHPVVILLSLAFWTELWGLSGAVLSVPLTAVAKVALVHMEHPYTTALSRCLEGHIDPILDADDEQFSPLGAPTSCRCCPQHGGFSRTSSQHFFHHSPSSHLDLAAAADEHAHGDESNGHLNGHQNADEHTVVVLTDPRAQRTYGSVDQSTPTNAVTFSASSCNSSATPSPLPLKNGDAP